MSLVCTTLWLAFEKCIIITMLLSKLTLSLYNNYALIIFNRLGFNTLPWTVHVYTYVHMNAHCKLINVVN